MILCDIYVVYEGSNFIFTVKGYIFFAWKCSICGDEVVAKQMYSVLQWNCPPAKQALTQCSPTHSSHPSGTTTGRMPCVFVLDTLCLQCSTSSQSQCGSGRHRGQTGRCPFWADGKKELTWDLFSSQRRDKERGKKEKENKMGERKRATDKQREGAREEESVSVGGKAGEEEGRGE